MCVRFRTCPRKNAISTSLRASSRFAVRYNDDAFRLNVSFSARSRTHSFPTNAAFSSSALIRRSASASRDWSCRWFVCLRSGGGGDWPLVLDSTHTHSSTQHSSITSIHDDW